MSCCPSGSWGELKNPDYKEKGVVETADDLPVYKVGESEKCIIWNYDVFGFDGGRTRQMADLLASCGFMVVIPDYYRGGKAKPEDLGKPELFDFIKKETKWDKLKDEVNTKVIPYCKKNGAKSFGTIGFCWGSYMVIRMSTESDIKAGVSMHPSHPPIMAGIGDDEEAIIKLVVAPQLFCPAGNDADSVKEGGLGRKILGDKLEVLEFPEMIHGWSVRGDLGDPKVERDVKKSFEAAIEFFKKHV